MEIFEEQYEKLAVAENNVEYVKVLALWLKREFSAIFSCFKVMSFYVVL